MGAWRGEVNARRPNSTDRLWVPVIRATPEPWPVWTAAQRQRKLRLSGSITACHRQHAAMPHELSGGTKMPHALSRRAALLGLGAGAAAISTARPAHAKDVVRIALPTKT